MEMNGYLVTHLGEGRFEVKLESGEIKEAGQNLVGMIRYTYFEDYFPKMQKDVLSGKLKPNQINY
jgi:hypothetical protein